MSAGTRTCTCGHEVVDSMRCTCSGRCQPCANVDCCADTWAKYIDAQPGEFTRHDYVNWDHCDACFATFERVNNARPL